MNPLRDAWQNQELINMSSFFDGFCQLLGLVRVGPYMQAKQAQKIPDWSEVPLDAEGKAIQEEMARKFQQLPLRSTKTLLAVSTDKLKKTDQAYELACALWHDTIPIILPVLLQLLGYVCYCPACLHRVLTLCIVTLMLFTTRQIGAPSRMRCGRLLGGS